MAKMIERDAVVHVRFNGRSFDVPMATLDVECKQREERR